MDRVAGIVEEKHVAAITISAFNRLADLFFYRNECTSFYLHFEFLWKSTHVFVSFLRSPAAVSIWNGTADQHSASSVLTIFNIYAYS